MTHQTIIQESPSHLENARKLSFIGFLNSYSDGMSGGDFAFIDFFKRLNPEQLVIITSEKGRAICIQNGLTAKFIITTKESIFSKPVVIYMKRILVGLLKILTLRNFDILYVSSDILPDVIPAIGAKMIGKLFRRKIVLYQKSFHINANGRKISSLSQKLSFILIKFFADQISTCSQLSKLEISAAARIPLDHISVTKLGVDFTHLSKIRPSHKQYHAVYLARLHESKGIFDLPEIWRMVIEKIPEAKLAIVGKGTEEVGRKLREQIQSYGLSDSIDILGFLAGNNGFELIRASQLYLAPSHEEGFGIAIAEALALGAPVLAYALPVYQEIFSNAIWTVDCFSASQFAAQCIELLSNQELRQRNLTARIELAENLSLERSTLTEALEIVCCFKRSTMSLENTP
jgi:glycosyltransferase involved in cell wall biosynthesis